MYNAQPSDTACTPPPIPSSLPRSRRRRRTQPTDLAMGADDAGADAASREGKEQDGARRTSLGAIAGLDFVDGRESGRAGFGGRHVARRNLGRWWEHDGTGDGNVRTRAREPSASPSMHFPLSRPAPRTADHPTYLCTQTLCARIPVPSTPHLAPPLLLRSSLSHFPSLLPTPRPESRCDPPHPPRLAPTCTSSRAAPPKSTVRRRVALYPHPFRPARHRAPCTAAALSGLLGGRGAYACTGCGMRTERGARGCGDAGDLRGKGAYAFPGCGMRTGRGMRGI
ncbi:hypothetical protein B0H11DRAFT_2238169 [Mycena galericulata]|nr:hypothetical protein B0H11DRAFT_2238169 [Mycena galericulata]